MDDETIRGLVRESLPKSLQCPFRSWVGRHVALQNTSRSELEHNKHVEQLELSRDRNHEVTSDHRIGVVAYEGRPALGRSCFATAVPQGQYFRTVREDTRRPSLK